MSKQTHLSVWTRLYAATTVLLVYFLRVAMQVWIRLYEATYYFQRYMWGRYNDTTQVMCC